MEIYTDGGCIGNPGPGGLGVVFIKDGRIVSDYQAGFKHTTNNRMEYRACIYALEQVKAQKLKNVTLFTDSKYVLQSVTEWGHKWKRLGWARNSSGSKKIENVDLFKRCYLLNESLDVHWQWVKGHAGNLGNERADDLANSAASWPRDKQVEDNPDDEPALEVGATQASLF